MPVMRSVFYTPSNNEKMVGKAPEILCDILTLDLEDFHDPFPVHAHGHENSDIPVFFHDHQHQGRCNVQCRDQYNQTDDEGHHHFLYLYGGKETGIGFPQINHKQSRRQ